jgi:LysR family glycine cleavage system transcriptional activator
MTDNCLPAFEAAARHRSFTKAAEELCFTQAAISFQVRNLESSLSVKLFLHRHRSLELTAEGTDLFIAVRTAFKTLAAQKTLITGVKLKKNISISAPISFCSKWLLSRLYRV